MNRFMKRLAALLLPAVLCVSLLGGCAGAEEGLSLPVSVGSAPVSLDPAYAEEPGDQTILAHLYENLMRVTVDGSGRTSVIGGMAKSVEQEEETVDGSLAVTYTFRLRSARWSDGQAVKASDFVYAWRRLADPGTNSPYAELLSMVSGYREARDTGNLELLQINAKNDSTLEVVLNGRHDWFLKEVCTSPATSPLRQDVVQKLKAAADEGKPWWSDPTALVTNGPYTAAESDGGHSLKLTASSRYYGDMPGPQSLTFHFVDTAEQGQTLYDSRAVDAVWPLTDAQLETLAASPEWEGTPELETALAVFNCAREPFSDVLIRQALSLAIDWTALVQAAAPTARMAEGVVPPGVPENEEEDFRTAGGPLLDNDPETLETRRIQARALLGEAGYDSGLDLGELEYLYVQSPANDAAAQELCRQWRDNLSVQVTPKGMTERDLMSALRNGEYTVAGLALAAPANDAECFLMDWTSGSQHNVAFYESSAYDTLMAIIASAADGTARMGCLHDAEALLLMDCAVVPLYTQSTAWTLRENLTGAFRDPRGWFCFSGTVTRPV